MKADFSEGINLPLIDYSEIFKEIVDILKDSKLNWIEVKENILSVDVDSVSKEITKRIKQKNNLHLSLIDGRTQAKVSSVNFKDRDEFKKYIEKVIDIVKNKIGNLPKLSQDINAYKIKETDYNSNLGKNLKIFTLKYPFKDCSDLIKKKITFNKVENSEDYLRINKLTITIFSDDIKGRIKDNLSRVIEGYKEDTMSFEILESKLKLVDKGEDSGVENIARILNEETIGKIKRVIAVSYLDFLYQNSKDSDDAKQILRNYIKRLKNVEDFLNSDRPDSDFKIIFGTPRNENEDFNLKYLLSESDILTSILPVAGLVEGLLGETNKGKEKQFVFGLKLKLNGLVKNIPWLSENDSSFTYHCNLLDFEYSKSKLEGINKENKLLSTLFLYYCVFKKFEDSDFDPIDSWMNEIVPLFEKSNQQQRLNFLKNFSGEIKKYSSDINKMVDLLKRTVKRKDTFIKKSSEKTLYLLLRRGILDLDSGPSIFKRFDSKERGKYLGFIAISEEMNRDALLSIEVRIRIDDMVLFDGKKSEKVKMLYDIDDFSILPVLMIPRNKSTEIEDSVKNYTHGIKIIYDREEDINFKNEGETFYSFVYKFTFSLISFLAISIVARNETGGGADIKKNRRMFIPIVRFHFQSEAQAINEVENFIRNISKVIVHLLTVNFLSSSQGINLKDMNKWKIQNALSSLYNPLPKKFMITDFTPNIKKLAVILVSSRECDRGIDYGKENRKVTLVGEIIGIDYKEGEDSRENRIILKTLTTFSKNYLEKEMYTFPMILKDKVFNLYRTKYNDILYIAKAPYTTNLNMTELDKEGLFFMSKDIIKQLKESTDNKANIYPIFFDKYYSSMINKEATKKDIKALYVEDASELKNIFNDESKPKSVGIFFNLFSGASVGDRNEEEKTYHSVVSYSTLLHIYDIIDDSNLIRNLIDERDIKEYITLIHFAKYEKDYKEKIKIDPYQNIIGDDSVTSKNSIFPIFMEGKRPVNINILSFLTEVREILWKENR